MKQSVKAKRKKKWGARRKQRFSTHPICYFLSWQQQMSVINQRTTQPGFVLLRVKSLSVRTISHDTLTHSRESGSLTGSMSVSVKGRTHSTRGKPSLGGPEGETLMVWIDDSTLIRKLVEERRGEIVHSEDGRQPAARTVFQNLQVSKLHDNHSSLPLVVASD